MIKHIGLFISFTIFFASFILIVHDFQPTTKKSSSNTLNKVTDLSSATEDEMEEGIDLDNDWFMTQRSYPNNDIPKNAFQTMRQTMNKQFAKKGSKGNIYSTGSWTLAGPSHVGGRITSLLIHPTNPDIIYAGSASGGVWKTTDFGYTWNNIFNESFSIGSLAFEPNNPSVIYVGTGEANPAGVATYPGNGIWRSTDAGVSWSNLGLAQTAYIGKIIVNPLNINELFVAALGLYRDKTLDRGIYKTTDRGSSWNKILYLNDTTGATDVVMDPSDTSKIFAAMWTRYRTPQASIGSGTASGLFRSTNGGTTWNLITNGFPNNDPSLGRISLAFAPSNPSIAYALVASYFVFGGIYKSTNGGTAWSLALDGSSYDEPQTWYNNVVMIHPFDPNNVWAGMRDLYHSTDGLATPPFYEPFNGDYHVDHHAMEYAPSDPTIVVFGNDGGIFISINGGSTWRKALNLPITQFYAGNIMYQNPMHLLGGTQDNGSWRTTNSIHDSWWHFYGGDGFYCLVDPTDSNYVYAEYQNGGLGYSTDGGNWFYDGTSGIGGSDRKNWETPIAMNPQNPKTLYTGTQYVYRTTDNMQSWTPISGDLTYGNGGRVGTISTIDVAPTDSNVIYVGTDDSRVWVTTNGGTTWQDIASSLPNRWVTRVTADPESANIAYVTLSGFIVNDYGGHIYRTTNYGTTWTNIGTTLPDIPLNDVLVDPVYRTHLYIATDLNVMFTTDLGTTWDILGDNLPETSVHDLAIHSQARKLAAFTHGRSAYTFVLPSAPNSVTIDAQINHRWNLISIPVNDPNSPVTLLFPTAVTGSTYSYSSNTYTPESSLNPGKGYWTKFPADITQTITGTPFPSMDVSVEAGWNLIGSTDHAIPVPAGGIISSNFFGYSNGYIIADSIKPGKGYWVKTSSSGSLTLGPGAYPRVAANDLKSISGITITDKNGNRQTLYVTENADGNVNLDRFEMPPSTPAGAFDVRYASQRILEAYSSSAKNGSSYPILIQNAQYPLEISFNLKNDGKRTFVLEEIESGKIIASHTVSDQKSITITKNIGQTLSLKVLDFAPVPAVYALLQNYPNPFNPSTTISFDLPENVFVSLKIYDITGREVEHLVEGNYTAGTYSVTADFSNLASGIYFYRLQAGKFSEIRKMVLVK